MTQQASTADTKLTLAGHRLSKDWTVVTIPGADFEVIIEKYERHDDTDSPFRVYVEEELIEARSEGVRNLSAREAALGDLRWCTRVEDGGENPEVDELYDALNAEIAAAKEAVTREALAAIADLLDGRPEDIQRVLDGARHDRYAGCRMCPCSPGVTLPARLSRNGETVVFNIRQARPKPKQHLSKPQLDALVAAKYERLIRLEISYPFRVYSTMTNPTTTFRPATIDKLFELNLIRTGDRDGSKRPLLLTEDGEFELFARS